MTIPMSFKFRKRFLSSSHRLRCSQTKFVGMRRKRLLNAQDRRLCLDEAELGAWRLSFHRKFCNGRHGRKTTVIVFKILGIERAWQNQGCVGPRPRQLFVTKSRLLAEKVERDYVSLLYSLSTGSDAPLYVRERVQRWSSRRKKEIFNPDDTGNARDDLPGKFSELCDSDFPLFLTMDTVSTSLPISNSGTDKDYFCTCSCVTFWKPT